MLVRTAWVEVYLSVKHPGENYAPSLQSAVDRNREIWASMFADVPVEDIECEYRDPAHPFFSEKHQKLVYTLLKLHVLSTTEGGQAATPTLEYLLEAEKVLLEENADPMAVLNSNVKGVSEFGGT
ncbi:hypothetical protein V492_08067, partial [Pseudogymnoascus sp. VKM F-4246]